ncbi:MAG: DedA family protein [Desulfobacterales bacterium]|nr:DedA family protein [Desulfobacterales bacterium]
MTTYLITQLGYAGLFIISFLAATLLPLGSEAAVAAMGASAFDPALVLTVATAGNSLGALVNYAVGRWGARVFFSRWLDVEPAALEKTRRICRRWGAPVLFFAWLPVIGDPLTVAAGIVNLRLAPFLFWVILGKGIRYLLVIQGAQALLT